MAKNKNKTPKQNKSQKKPSNILAVPDPSNWDSHQASGRNAKRCGPFGQKLTDSSRVKYILTVTIQGTHSYLLTQEL